MKRRILFVDDEPNLLEGLKRMLRSMRHEWETEFVGSGREALDLLSVSPFDVLVTDMRIPGMDGVQLLTEVMKSYPQIVRIILSGELDKDLMMQSVRVSHQALSKPCKADILKLTIKRTCALFDLMADDSLKKVISRMDTLPSLPSLYSEIVSLLKSPDGSIREVGKIIEKDTGMTSKILQLANSAFFGISHKISSPAEAAVFLGLDTIKSLVLSFQVFSQFDLKKMNGSFLEKLRNHHLKVGIFARAIAKQESREQEMIDHSFLAGLLHDSGKLVLAANFPDQYRLFAASLKKENIPVKEREIFGVTHSEVGAYLMGLWGLPTPIIEALALHHCPISNFPEKRFGALTAVYTANFLEHESSCPHNNKTDYSPINSEYLSGLNLADHLADWRKTCQGIERGENINE